MRLYFWKSPHGNVGDDLNPWLWPRVFGPQFFSAESPPTFFGIGSIFDARCHAGADAARRNIIFGAGLRKARGYQPAPERLDIRFVRGPRSAAALAAAGLEGVRFISDPAILTPRFAAGPVVPVRGRIGFIPYYNTPLSLSTKIAAETGMTLVPITATVDDFLDRLRQCEFIVTEAMHGAILADAFRIPWAACRLSSGLNEGRTSHFKWQDWSESLGVRHHLPSAVPGIVLHMPHGLRRRFHDVVITRSLATVQKVLARADWTLSDAGRLRQAQDDILAEAARLADNVARPMISRRA